jgi:death-on-curing protein
MYFLTVDEVLAIHELVIARAGSSAGVRDKNLLQSAVLHPQTFVFGQYLYTDVYRVAAAYCFHIIKNHPFVDGNKRTGILTAITFLEKNGLEVFVDMDLWYNLAIDIAQSKIFKEEITIFFKSCSFSRKNKKNDD